jgi:hypothetical protein
MKDNGHGYRTARGAREPYIKGLVESQDEIMVCLFRVICIIVAHILSRHIKLSIR